MFDCGTRCATDGTCFRSLPRQTLSRTRFTLDQRTSRRDYRTMEPEKSDEIPKASATPSNEVCEQDQCLESPNTAQTSSTTDISELDNLAKNLTLAKEADSTPEKKTNAKLEKEKQRELAKLERARVKEEERQKKLQQREAEKLERERKKEEERLAREKKKQQDALLREQKKLEEKERKEQERLLKKQMLEEERAQKKEEKKRKYEEDLKKKEDDKRRKDERSQMRISSFFSVSQEPNPLTKTSDNPKSSPVKPDTKDRSYDADFLPFFQKSNVILASPGQLTSEVLQERKNNFNQALESETKADLSSILSIEARFIDKKFTTSRQLVEALNSLNLTESTVLSLVNNLAPIRYLQFYENSKPPYIGTWCSEDHLKVPLRATSPLDTSLTGYDYGYDSDLDWQDEGEGEDIDDLEDCEEEEEDGDDDMDDFVDNSELLKKRGIVGPLQAVSIWNDGSEEHQAMFNELKYEILDVNSPFPIDPFKGAGSSKMVVKVEHTDILGEKAPTPTPQSSAPNLLTPQKPIIKDPKVVEELIRFIEKNSDFTIGTLTELAKKEFKTYTKNILKYTIQSVAIYNKKDNGWKIKEPAQ